MIEDILANIEKKWVSRFTHNGKNYSIYKKNEVEYNLVKEDEKKIKKRLKKFKTLNDIFDHIGLKKSEEN